MESAGAAGGSIRVGGAAGDQPLEESAARDRTRAEAVEEWIALHGAAVLRLAYASLLHRAQAEDVFQEVFIKAYRHADRLQDPERVRPWLLQVTMNACRDLRRSWWWRRTREGSGLEGLAEAGRGSEADPAAAAERSDVSQALARAVRMLPDGFRETVVLHYFEGLDAAEIARITGVRVGTVHSRLHRARQLLRQQLEAWGVEP
ncbi:MAG: sigma-70 family RNA polymerase sigma factor [Symbiobacteriaceae bacterium]|nr:MAG: hypothetical protein DIU55_02140 [Bacillota bacterium]